MLLKTEGRRQGCRNHPFHEFLKRDLPFQIFEINRESCSVETTEIANSTFAEKLSHRAVLEEKDFLVGIPSSNFTCSLWVDPHYERPKFYFELWSPHHNTIKSRHLSRYCLIY